WARDGNRMLTALRRLCGQASTGPSGLAAQSCSRMRAPISPPPARKSARRARGSAAASRDLPIGRPPDVTVAGHFVSSRGELSAPRGVSFLRWPEAMTHVDVSYDAAWGLG